ncbi:hypothetical protein PLICRDRAFT_268207 [Plicaturopsis crispa FD-325 SS-3]|nr:hypothetical protein PLICRDRAFT_268207 [Plicaturopsis crispa FD-325 SS-3]
MTSTSLAVLSISCYAITHDADDIPSNPMTAAQGHGPMASIPTTCKVSPTKLSMCSALLVMSSVVYINIVVRKGTRTNIQDLIPILILVLPVLHRTLHV